MSTINQHKVYCTAALSLAFISGVIFSLCLKETQRILNTRKRNQRNGDIFIADGRSHTTCEVNLEDHIHSRVKNKRTKLSSPEIPEGIHSIIGNTPLFKIKSLSEATGRIILAKAEFLNAAGGSSKDRVALSIIRIAEEQGIIAPGRGDTLYEGTVGSTGISLTSLARALGYNTYICMPSDQSQEKIDLLLYLGAQVERVTPVPITSSEHYVNLARRRASEHNISGLSSRGFFVDQFENLANLKAHFSTTGPEIWNQTGGQLDAFVAGAGTGGTVSGIALYLKQKMGMGRRLEVVLADPEGSGLYNKIKHGVMFSSTEKEGKRRRHQVDSIVEGIGINRLTENFEVGIDLIDDSIKVTDLQAMKMARWLVEKDGIFVGSSSAVNCVAAVRTALKMPKDSRIVTILCDSGTRHLSKFWREIDNLEPEEDGADIDILRKLGIGDNIEISETFVSFKPKSVVIRNAEA